MTGAAPTARREKAATLKRIVFWLFWLWALLAGTAHPADGGVVRPTARVRFGEARDVCTGEGVLFAPAVLYPADESGPTGILSGWTVPTGRPTDRVFFYDDETVPAGATLSVSPQGEAVTAAVDGWFSVSCDGWESVWSPVDPAALDLPLYDELCAAQPAAPAAAKLVTGGALYAAFAVRGSPCVRVGESYPLTLPDGTCRRASLIRADSAEGRTLLVCRVVASPASLCRRRGVFCLTTATLYGCLTTGEAVCGQADGQPFVLVRRGCRAVPRTVCVTELSDGRACLSPGQNAVWNDRTVLPLCEGEEIILDTTGLAPFDELYVERNGGVFRNLAPPARRTLR